MNLARIIGGDVLNRVPDRCTYDLDVRYLPNQDPEEIVRQIRSVDIPADVEVLFYREPTYVTRQNPYVKALREVSARHFLGNPVGVGRRPARATSSTSSAQECLVSSSVQLEGDITVRTSM